MKHDKDYYQNLGVGPTATSAEIKRAYRRLAILNHPDRNPATQATLRMQEINEAYSILGDKRKRIKYDSERGNSTTVSQTTSSPQATTAATDLQQIFAEDVAPRIRFISRVAIPVILVLAISSVVCGWVTSQAIFVIYTFYILMLGGGIVFLWELLKSSEIETRCPKCRKFGAAEKLNEELTGVFQKKHFIIGFLRLKGTDILVTFERYKIHCRCKHCLYEWFFIYTKRQSLL